MRIAHATLRGVTQWVQRKEVARIPNTAAGPRGLHGRKQQSTFRGRQGESGRIGKSD